MQAGAVAVQAATDLRAAPAAPMGKAADGALFSKWA
jgi:hypothetical protein